MAEKYFRLSLSKNPDYWAAYHNLAYLFENRFFEDPLHSEFNDKSIEYYDKAIKADSEQSVSYYRMSKCYARSKRFEEAEAFVKKAVELNSEEIEYQISLASILNSNNKYNEAIQIYENLLKTTKNTRINEVRFSLAIALENNNQVTKALEQLQLLKTESDEPFILRNLARIYQKLQDYQTSFDHYMQYLETEKFLNPLSNRDKIDTLIDISMEHMFDVSSFDPAWVMFVWNYIPLAPFLSESDKVYCRGVICINTGSFKSAIKYFEKSLSTEEHEENKALINIRLGDAHLKLNDTTGANKYFKKVLAANPTGTSAMQLIELGLIEVD